MTLHHTCKCIHLQSYLDCTTPTQMPIERVEFNGHLVLSPMETKVLRVINAHPHGIQVAEICRVFNSTLEEMMDIFQYLISQGYVRTAVMPEVDAGAEMTYAGG